MTILMLFDALSRQEPPTAASGETEHSQIPGQFAEELVLAAIADHDRLRAYERRFAWAPMQDSGQELEVRQSVWRVFANWADEAEGVLLRARSLAAKGRAIQGVDQLDLAVGRVRARLTVSPEKTVQAMEDARQGRVIPAEELRDELRARLRA